MNNDAASKHGGSGGGELGQRVAAVESRLSVIEKTMVTTEAFQHEMGAVRGEIGGLRDDMHKDLGAVRVEIAKIPFELVKWLVALAGIAAAIATTVYNLWFR